MAGLIVCLRVIIVTSYSFVDQCKIESFFLSFFNSEWEDYIPLSKRKCKYPTMVDLLFTKSYNKWGSWVRNGKVVLGQCGLKMDF